MVSGIPKNGIRRNPWTPENRAKWTEARKKRAAEYKARCEAAWNALSPEEQKKRLRAQRNAWRNKNTKFLTYPRKMNLDGAQECFGHLDQADCEFCPLINTCARMKAAVGEAIA